VCQLENDYTVVEGESLTKLLFCYLDICNVLGLVFILHVVILATNLDVLFELLEWTGWTTIVSQRGGSREKSCFIPMNL
jgi:hypothetical protein